MNVLVTARLNDYKLATHIQGLIDSERVDRIAVVRRWPLRDPPQKIRNVSPAGIFQRSAILFEIWRFFTLRRLIRAERVDLLVGLQLRLHGIQAAVAGWMARVPVVLALIGSDVQIHLRIPWKRPFLKWAIGRASAITVMGPGSRDILVKAGLDHIHTVEMQVYQDGERFAPRETAAEWDLLFIGSLIPLKRVHTLLEALARAKQSLPELRLAVLGDGPERDRLRELAESLGVAPDVTFLGFRTDVENYLNRSRVFVLASQSEGLPSAAIEAMFCGLPVILSDVGDVRGMFTPEYNSLIVPKDDVAALADAIARLAGDKELYRRLNKGALETRGKHMEQWSRQGCIREWEAVLEVAVP